VVGSRAVRTLSRTLMRAAVGNFVVLTTSNAFPQTPPSASPSPATTTTAPTSTESESLGGPPSLGRLFSLPPPEVRSWYGYQTLALDALSTVLITVGIVKWNGYAGAAGAASFLLGPPIVHMAHGQGWKGLYDMGLLRVTEPLVSAGVGAAIGAIVGAKTGCGAGGDDIPLPCGTLPGLLIGLGVGMVAAVAVDASVFAWDTKPAATDSQPKRAAFGPSMAPTVILMCDDRNRVSKTGIGVEGTF
jgi:hypothetical protein